MKKILFIANNLQFSDGCAICLKNLANEMSNSYEVHILNLYICQKEFIKDINDNVKIHSLFGFYFKGLRTITNLLLVPFICKLKLFQSIKFDYIVCYQHGAPCVIINYISKSSKKLESKLIGFVHGYNNDYKKYYMNLDSIVSISEDGKERLIQDYEGFHGKIVHLKNIYSVRDIIDKSTVLTPDIEKAKKNGALIYCTVSRLSPEKRIDRFITATYKAHQKNSRVIAFIVGDGPSKDSLHKLISKYHAEDYIFMVGAKDNPYPYISGCDFYCCSSISEGLCTSCVEAAILKKPILSTDVSGAKEIIYNPTIGYIVDNNDYSFTEGFEKIAEMQINDEVFAQSSKKWNVKSIADSYIAFFESLN